MKHRSLGIVNVVLMVVCFALTAKAQQTAAVSISEASAVPRVVNFSGRLTDLNGKPLTGITGVTFLLYKDEQGGAPLWLETQNVRPDETGHYTVTLGSTTSHGLPEDVFVSGEARWLAIQIQGQNEKPRVLLVAVPYALKAHDAETIGGLPPSAFMLAAPAAANNNVASSEPATAPPPVGTITGAGTAGFLPDFTGATTIGNSAVFQTGASPTARIGINNAAPAATLDVTGSATVRGLFTHPATGTAIATGGKVSQAQNFVASVFNSGTSTAVPQTFQWKAEPINNNTTTASGTLNLLFAQGTAALAETGLRINKTGILTFASGQSFPGTGTVKSVATGLGLTGGPITSSGTVSINPAVVPRLGSSNAFTGNQSITGNLTVSGTVTGGTFSGNGASLSNVNAAKLGGLLPGAYAQLAAANPFTNLNSFSVNSSSPDLSVGNSGSGDGIDISLASGIGVYVPAGGQGFHASTSGDAGVFEGGFDGSYNLGPSAGVWAESDTDANYNTASYAYEFGSTTGTIGVHGYSASTAGAGSYNEAIGSSSTGGTCCFLSHPLGSWSDSSGIDAIGALTTVDNGWSIVSYNNSSLPTIWAQQYGSGSILHLAGPTGSCDFDGTGGFTCTGTKSAVVPVQGGSRQVALYATEAAENWFEDAGSAQLSNGLAVVNLEGIFGQTVNTEVDYHVFLTPNGDCKGLYVAQKSPASFVVRELGGGTSSIAFDYRIMAKRRGYENVRLADKTATFSMAANPSFAVRPGLRSPKALPSPQTDREKHRAAAQQRSLAQLHMVVNKTNSKPSTVKH